MNKARMTFRFDDGQSRELDRKEQTPTFGEPTGEGVHELEANGHREHRAADREPRDKLSVISGPMQGWGDPFSRDDIWDEMMTSGSQYPNQDHLDEDYKQDDPNLYQSDDIYDGSDYLTGSISGSSVHMVDGVPAEENFSYRPHRPTSLWKVIGTVTGAVVTGALFGFVVLSLFKDGSGGTVMNPKQAAEGQKTAISVHAQASTDGELAAAVPVDIKAQTYYMLQYGVFSTSERALQAQKELLQYGIAAGNDPDHENRVYAGISTDREQAKLLSNQLKAQGMDLYVREIALPAEASLHFNGEGDTVNQYFTASSKLVAELCQMSASLLGKDQPARLSSNETAALTDLHQQWTEASKSFQTGLNQEADTLGKQLDQTMNSALSSVEEYNKNSSKGHLWEIQSVMMQYIIQQKELMTLLEK